MDHSGPTREGGELALALTVNGEARRLTLPPNVTLLEVLRDRLGLTGTKKGCDHGQCGACTVRVDGQAMNACLRLAVMCEGQEVTTVEGLASEVGLHPVQRAFLEHDAYQCGFCTPGQMMSASALLEDERIGSDDAAVREAMSGNICRCGAYKNILEAIHTAREELASQRKEGGIS
ncbi:xanthine dehydrogenase YagT iron-sulfur-binding subunit [Modicisalibacter ilicicola DSM 19980]|uniref:Xanthine dehydrogenase YagT iron-sulfur-binding subunit n=2 Tax=Modicisalibacter ilicicola TaxID=480814 RepID=A0A1M5EG87_9GAMM|nr:xanthine dehydrogenase YagT iron-sulfur-binding subunit [Halomonas ilicicola DSM 19980]